MDRISFDVSLESSILDFFQAGPVLRVRGKGGGGGRGCTSVNLSYLLLL